MLQTELLEKNQSLNFMPMRDPLTAMVNRHFMLEHCEQERPQCLRNNTPVCLIGLDIDFFKVINDNHGHCVGDEVVKEIANRVTKVMREMDVASRWGGEEFLILCPNTKAEEAAGLAQRVNKSVASHPFKLVGQITCSLGVAELRAEGSFTQWYDHAGTALYQAKSSGRNKVVCVE